MGREAEKAKSARRRGPSAAFFSAIRDGAMIGNKKDSGADMDTLMSPRDEARGKYEVLRVVNRGGMGEIALARVKGTKGFEKLVVLKRLRADAEREDHIQMFDVEQEVMSRMEHPNVVKVFDQPVIDGIPYLAMEYIRGRNLDQVVRAASQHGEELSGQFALSTISEVLRGLAFVHRLKDNEGRALGVVHQDMTPSNVLVSFFGEVKITDFGISYVTSRDGGLRKGVLKGKPRYVAPEVLAGKRVNNTADIYGVGVVLYELLTGRALFARPSVKETLGAVARNELPNFHEELRQYGDGIARILDRCLKKDPGERYRTAESMAADVLNELSKRGGPLPAATLGYQVRHYFKNDPDVPEIDPTLEQAITMGGGDLGVVPQDLDETLLELDRLLGDEQSVDLFSVPADLQTELSDLEDMDPFAAETPLPDFLWDANSEAEILRRADAAYGHNPLVREPSPLFEAGPPSRLPPPKEKAALPTFPAKPEAEPSEAATADASSAPKLRADDGVVVEAPVEAKPEAAPVEVKPEPAPQPVEDRREPEPVAEAKVAEAKPVVEAKPVTEAGPVAEAKPIAEAKPETPPVVETRPRPATPVPVVHAPPAKSNGFWLGLVLGLGAGAAIGAAVFAALGG